VARILRRTDFELVEVMRSNLVPLYIADLKGKGFDAGTAKRLANRKFDNELANGRLQVASEEDLREQHRKSTSIAARLRNLRTRFALKLIAPKGGGQ
jgi:hypothetical protein